VTESRLPAHPLVDASAEERLMHAREQSMRDWVDMRYGRINSFPDGVAFPESDEDVRGLLKCAKDAGATVIPYGGGTSVVGHITPCPNDRPVLSLSLEKTTRLLDLDETSCLATFQAGVAGPQLEEQWKARGYTLGHFPQSFGYSTLGGWIVTHSSGQQSYRYGKIESLFAGGLLETPRGRLEIKPIPASAAGMDIRLGFLYACLQGDKIPGWVFGAGLTLYDIMAGQWSHRSYDLDDTRELCPLLTTPALRGGYRYFDANTDDARLLLRLLRESVADGGHALNYARVDSLLKTPSGGVCGVVLRDTSGEAERQAEVRAKVIINATGAWADELRGNIQQKPRMRPLRGSHLILPFNRLPITRAVSFLHPRDGRPVMAIPWEGTVLFGTTDVDHKGDIQTDPSISSSEAGYLMEALRFVFPAQEFDFKESYPRSQVCVLWWTPAKRTHRRNRANTPSGTRKDCSRSAAAS
jgi:glycine/D-amino acid oxidase-like deaminating enzyme